MKYYAKVISLDPDVEEAVTISLGEIELTCFICDLNNPIQSGSIYLVDLEFEIFNEISVELATETLAKQIGESFSYELSGYLTENKLIISNVIFEDDLLYEASFYENKGVKIYADRINISFLN
ncbi:hypothetical protein [Morganella morganii]|uniref:hypothetical protein n=1 Tax=Morganella morganii TaxID=582 RepID=UPI0023688BE2|nr:hypothetical protein [Morganella morganii]